MYKTKDKLYVVLLVIVTLFMGIGYASINSVTFNMIGSSSAKKSDGIKITDITYLSSDTSDNSSVINSYDNTIMNSTINLSDDISSYVTYKITLYNNSDYDYMYDSAVYDDKFYSNENIIYLVSGINKDDIIKSGETKNITITFKYKTSNISRKTLDLYINFKFIKLYEVFYNDIENNNYPKYIKEGDDLNINLPSNIYDVSLNGANNYDYSNNILSIPNIKSNISISPVDSPNILYSVSLISKLDNYVNKQDFLSSLDSSYNIYAKYNVVKNIIKKVEICKNKDNNKDLICLDSMNSDSYNDNKNLVLSYFGGNINNIPSECILGNNKLSCENEYISIKIDDKGSVLISDLLNNKSCNVDINSNIYTCK